MSYAGMADAKASASNRIVDLRSDTVTRPGEAMRRAMAAAEVGDDVYGEDATVTALEEKTAALLGKEAGLFVASGTQSNLLALLAHCQRGEEYIAGETYHSYAEEGGGASVLGGIAVHPLAIDARGAITPEQVESAIKPDDFHYPVTRLVCLENTVSGHVQSVENQQAIADVARRHGLSVHLDGARLMNAAVALGRPPAEVGACADSVSLCLSKGLGAPVGSVLSGSRDFIARARRSRKMLGGGMRQAGILAAAGLYALDHHVDRLAEDHANAKRLAEGLAACKGLAVDTPETNMVFIAPRAEDLEPLRAHLAERGIIIAAQRPKTRLVTHLDITSEDIERTIEAFRAFYKG
ncbi:MAG: low-specificity L-threonine aldolase [Alphaproteobacteria bacterium]|nr:low-specificity L-threonine aldolase [Alphaproteobacteria bacterium]